MPEFDDKYSEYRREAEKRATSGVTAVADHVRRWRKAYVVPFATAVTGFLATWLGADAPLTLAVVALVDSVLVGAVPNAPSGAPQGEDGKF